ncbi:hypothetical protein B0H10DRAFT_2082558 [Mycena sp. CBHHK59/15]|nr:hypothetical protein B0H10DRAFT_2082558 [Mycena sp. CBHHK59/15]
MSDPPLPPLETLQLDPDGLIVWRLLLSAEATALNDPTPPKYQDNLVGVRLLGFFLKDFWDHQQQSYGLIPYKHLLVEIRSCFAVPNVTIGSAEEAQARHEKVYALGIQYCNHLLRVFRSDERPHTWSGDSSCSSLDKVRDMIVARIAEAPTTEADVKVQALARDGYRCMITGTHDFDACQDYPELDAQAHKTVPTECAHLFSESAQAGDKDPTYPASVFAILTMFGLGGVVTKLLDGRVNSLHDILAMSEHWRGLFYHFWFWLEKVPNQRNTYNVYGKNEGIFKIQPEPRRRVTFQVDPAIVAKCQATGIPMPALPSPALIAIRAACARVAHMSGAAEQFNQIFRDREETQCMADDGSTAGFLTSLLLQTVTPLVKAPTS